MDAVELPIVTYIVSGPSVKWSAFVWIFKTPCPLESRTIVEVSSDLTSHCGREAVTFENVSTPEMLKLRLVFAEMFLVDTNTVARSPSFTEVLERVKKIFGVVSGISVTDGADTSANAVFVSLGVIALAIDIPCLIDSSGVLKFKPRSMLNFFATSILLSNKFATHPQVASPLKVCADLRMSVTRVPLVALPEVSSLFQKESPPSSAPSCLPRTFL